MRADGPAARAAVLGAAVMLLSGCEPRDPNRLPVPAHEGAMAPHLARSADGTIALSWLEGDGRGHRLRFAVLEGKRWSEPATVTAGEDWFVNWADFPSVVPIDDSLWAAHWLQKSAADTYAYDVRMSLSRDAGNSWGPAFSPHRDGTPTEHGFVSLYPATGGIGVAWLDGRDMPRGGPMSLRHALVNADGIVSGEAVVDSRVCDCCQTDVAMTPGGPIVVYRDRSDAEVRDIAMSRFVDGSWSTPVTVVADDWTISGCPVNGPAIDARGDTVVVAWYTAADRPTVRIARSNDGGAHFAPATDVASDDTLGRVDVVLLDNGDAIVSWLRTGGTDAADIVATRVRASGEIGNSTVIAHAAAARLSGFPQMLATADALLFAWTAGSGDDTRIESARLSQLP